MREWLGLSIGTTNFVAVRTGEPPVVRRSQLVLFSHRPPQIGAAELHDTGDEIGMPITGFVERVGDREPVLAPDGSTYLPDLLVVDAIDAMVSAARPVGSDLAIAVPAYWPPSVWQALQEALVADTDRTSVGAAPYLVSDAVAALTAVDADRGVPSDGVVALLDFGGGGTDITLADAGFGFQPVDETLRHHEFCGNVIDQALLAHVVAGADQDEATDGTVSVSGVGQLVDACRAAKEALSERRTVELVAELPAGRTEVTVTRDELERLIDEPLDGVVAALTELLRRHGMGGGDLAALVVVGGGAHIPLIAERLSARYPAPVIVGPHPESAAAAGAALCAARQGEGTGEQTATARAATPPAPVAPTVEAPAGSATPNELAWSQEENRLDDVMPFIDDRTPANPSTGRRPAVAPPPIEKGRPAHRVPRFVVGLGVLVALVSIVGVIYTLSTGSDDEAPAPPASTVPVAPQPITSTTPASTTPASTVAPSPSSPVQPPPETSTEPPEETTTEPPETTTTTTEPPPTSTTTITTTTTTQPPAPTTTEAPPAPASAAATTVPMTTEYLTIPLVPVPIPIPVPAG